MDNTYIQLFSSIDKLQKKPCVGLSFITFVNSDGERIEAEVSTKIGAEGRESVINPKRRQHCGIVHAYGTTFYWTATAFNTSKIKFI